MTNEEIWAIALRQSAWVERTARDRMNGQS